MEYFKSGLKTVLGAQPGTATPSGAETVEKLVERLQTSTLLDDRRDACRALKALSKPYRLEVGAQAMDALIHVLEMDRSDAEIVGYALDALTNVIAYLQDEEDFNAEMSKEAEALGIQFTDIYIKKSDNVVLLLELLEEQDFKVRWPAVKLLTSLLIGRPKELQECILVSPMGVSRLMDLLVDSREVIRNDALLLLGHLTKGNANIQKIVAFDNAFDRLLDIITEEGYSDGGVIVEDCLLVLLNLLKSNVSNQNLFKEGSYIQKLTPFFDLQKEAVTGDKGWSAQKVSNIHLMLQVIRTLVSPNNPMQVVSSCQKVMNQCGLLEQLCNILMASGVPADILTEDINTVAEVIRGHHGNQEYFATVTAPSNPPSSAIVVLLMSMVNEKQPFVLRCAVLYCFQCFLYRNELGQAQVIQTLLPTSANTVSQVTAGQLLCGGLFSIDPVSNWFAAVALSHALVDNSTQKEQLVRVQLATSVGNPPISLMKQCTTILQQGGKVQTRLGLLMLLCTWLSSCIVAVNHFLSIPTNIPYLTSQVNLAEGDEHEDLVQGVCALLLGICIEFNDDSVSSFTKENLISLIKKRIGLEMFLDKLKGVSLNDSYTQAAQKPHLKHRQPQDILFDYEFCKLFKSLEGTVIKAMQPNSLTNGPESNMSREQHSLLQQYKEMIRDQDQKLHDLRSQFENLSEEHTRISAELLEANSCVQQLRDQNSLLKAQRSTGSSSTLAQQTSTEKSESDEKLLEVQKELEELRIQHSSLQEELKKKSEELLETGELKPQQTETSAENSSELQRVISEQESEIKSLKSQMEISKEEVETLKSKDAEIQHQKMQINRLAQERKSTIQKMFKVNEKNKRLEQECSQLKETVEELEKKLDTERKEEEDLLVLLTEQDSKMNTYKKMIRELGGKIEDEDDIEDEDSGGEDRFLDSS